MAKGKVAQRDEDAERSARMDLETRALARNPDADSLRSCLLAIVAGNQVASFDGDGESYEYALLR